MLVLAAVAAVLVVATALYRARSVSASAPDGGGEMTARATPHASPPTDDVFSAGRRMGQALRALTPRRPPGPAAQMADAEAHRRYVARYHGLSTIIPLGAKPWDPSRPTEYRSRGGAPVLTAWVRENFAEAGADAIIEATLVDETGAPVMPETANIFVFEQSHPEEGVRADLSPAGAPEAGRFAYRFRPDRARLGFANAVGKSTPPPVTMGYMINMTGTFDAQAFDRTVIGWLTVQSPGASAVTGQIRFMRGDDGLTVRVPIDVQRTGRYWMKSELWGGPDGTLPIAQASTPPTTLEAGQREMTMTFGGEIILERGIDGPYTIRNILVEQADTLPPHVARAPAPISTPPFLASELGGAPPPR